MIKKTMIMESECGLHMRPAMRLVELSQTFSSDIKIVKGDMEANAESILEITILAVANGEEIEIIVEGNDEEEAMKALEELIENNFEMKVKQ